MKSTYVLGINEALGASACLLRDGKIIAAATEERFTRIKNQPGFPKSAIEFCCDFAGIKPQDLNLVVLSYIDPYPHFMVSGGYAKEDFAPDLLRKLGKIAPYLEYKIPIINLLTDAGRFIYYRLYQPKNQEKQVSDIKKFLKIPKEKIIRVNHHLCHAYTAYFANPNRSDQKTLVLTNDGAGDQISAAVFLVNKGMFKLVAKTPHKYSLGLFYSAITGHLGLKAHEHEYKVMGLAPYTTNSDLSSITKKFRSLIWVEDLKFKSKIPSRQFGTYLNDKFVNTRFDWLAGATQKHFEKLMTAWVTNTIKKTKVRNLAFAGGSFLNVKANQEISKLKAAKSLFFMPSPGDDTNALGAAFFGFKHLNPKSPLSPISNLYLGPNYSEKDILKALKSYPKLKFTKIKNIESLIARLLSRGKIVARFAGRMEFGARALGNRSILADPRNGQVIEKINKMIKMRDFWMPFAPTIASESADKYIKNPKNVDASYMILVFDTTEAGKKDLAAAIHPYDKSVRPQILAKSRNPSYYKIIREFERLTGVGALLNTSFNIHGEPIVASPNDALSTFVRSGLEYLAIEDFLITK